MKASVKNHNDSSISSQQENTNKLISSFHSPEKPLIEPEMDLYYIDQQLIQCIMEHLTTVMGIFEKSQKMVHEFKTTVSGLRQDVNKLRHNILNENDETKNRVIPLLESLRRNFFNQMYVDKQEQENLQVELVNLKKERYEMDEMIIWCLSKITVLEDQIGYYKKQKKEKLEEDEYQKKRSLINQ